MAQSLSWETPFGVAARQTLERLLGQMLKNLPGTKLGEDLEALHDMRVASRRIRAAFRVFRPCFPRILRKDPEMRVKQVTQALGQVRDQDVLLDYLGRAAVDTAMDIDWLIDRESRIREGGRLRMIAALDDLEQGDLPAQMESLLKSARMTQAHGEECRHNQFWRQAAPLVADGLGIMDTLAPSMDHEDDDGGLHAMRIAAKRLRYTMEAFIPCFGNALAEKIDVVKLLQEQLGELHDSDVWLDKLEQYQKEPGLSPERLSAVGMLIADRRAHRAEMYRAASAHWRGLVNGHFAEDLLKLVSAKPTKIGPKEVNGMEQEVKTTPNAEDRAVAPKSKNKKQQSVSGEMSPETTGKKQRSVSRKGLPESTGQHGSAMRARGGDRRRQGGCRGRRREAAGRGWGIS